MAIPPTVFPDIFGTRFDEQPDVVLSETELTVSFAIALFLRVSLHGHYSRR